MGLRGCNASAFALTLTVIASCSTTLSEEYDVVASRDITFPTEIDGVLNEGWEVYVMQYDTCVAQQKDYCEVFERAKKDTYIAQLFSKETIQPNSIEEMTGLTREEFEHAAKRQTEDNDRWLSDRIDQYGWFNISDYGPDADKAAFFIVQHSGDFELQSRVAVLLEPLMASAETSKPSFALLTDRVAIKDGREQTYGSQGECRDGGGWKPFPIAPGDVDRLRAQMELASMADYTSRMAAYCPS